MSISRACNCVEAAHFLKFSLTVSKPFRDISNSAGMFTVALSKKTPVGVLFGWLSCQKKHLDKYTNMYEQQGCAFFKFVFDYNFLIVFSYEYY